MKQNYERGLRILREAGYDESDLPNLTDRDLKKIPNMGRKYIAALRNVHAVTGRVTLQSEADWELLQQLVARLGGSLVKD